jgi:DNA uptake protein ComE-like DNA-binding protein
LALFPPLVCCDVIEVGERMAIELDLNEATEKQLKELPGVGRTSAERIIAGRPYASVMDLSKIGLPYYTLRRIVALVIVKSAG